MGDMLSRNEISEVKLTSLHDQLPDCLTKGTVSTDAGDGQGSGSPCCLKQSSERT